ncbi:MAG: methyltransferase [Massilia sp.]|nr:methyltransferase [Massilia sp.]
MSKQPIGNCIVCGNAKRAGLTSWHAVCGNCEYESTDLHPAINEEATHHFIDEQARERSLKALRLENFKSIVESASRLARPGAATLLDVGSAHGWFLEAARARFTVLGIEPDETIRQLAQSRGLPVRGGYFPDALHPGESFDIIVFNDVIEHIPDIGAAVKASHARLNEGGILILNLPSSAGFFYRLSKLFARAGWVGPFERLWQKGMPSPHVHYFRHRNINELVGRNGFELVSSSELPSLRADGLLERLRFAGNVGRFASFAQYLVLRCVIPVLQLFPSDIIVCVFRKT